VYRVWFMVCLYHSLFLGSLNVRINRHIASTVDGRVLQVEYASAAASHSSCVVVAPIQNDTVVIFTTRPAGTVQEQLVVLKDSHTVVALSGILTDSLALLPKGAGRNSF
jgi:20S proteasome alpha/beta subunit